MSINLHNEPQQLWYYFNEILQIPRASRKEEKIRAYLIEFAKKHELEYLTDEAGNLLIRKPAIKVGATAIVLQTHMDMVCEKNADKNHNFDTDPIDAYQDGDLIKANGTTLGSDNGIGIAAQLAVLAAKDLAHGDIECLFTSDEETGLHGANGLQANWLLSNTLLNLDSEEEGEFCVGCAGGMDTIIEYNTVWEEVPANLGIEICINGLQGGHSGEDINKGRANAIKLLAELLFQIDEENLQICTLDGGNLRNAIPREVKTTICGLNIIYDDLAEKVQLFAKQVAEKYSSTDPDINISMQEVHAQHRALSIEQTDLLIKTLVNCPNGVISMTAGNNALVETSTNLAAVHLFEKTILIETSQRSSSETKKNEIAEQVALSFPDATISKGKDYPGWEPNFDSAILKTAQKSYTDLFQKTPIVKTIHAGLECGVISKKYPNMDMLSFGPTIENPHSPFECVSISSTEKFWKLLVNILQY